MSAPAKVRVATAAGTSKPANGPATLVLTVELSPEQLDALAALVATRLGGLAGPTPATWVDARGAAAYLACGVGRIHDLVALGKVTPRRDGRRLLFRRDDLDAYLEHSA